ncbi:MAG: vanadium nitrogenase [Lachnospiraceae bacterium]|nr:vanadium nitrogenase [Lachnospiraceae bacterium]
MTFLASLIQYALKFVLMAAVAGCGLFLGKKLRDRKDSKTAAMTQQEK